MSNSSNHHEEPTGFSKTAVLFIMAFAAAGTGVGLGLSYWETESQSKGNLILWLGLIGDMFIRALKACVLPMIFVNVVLAIVDMISMGRASAIAMKTLGMYLLTTLIASTIGLISILIFKPLFDRGEFDEDEKSFVSLFCNNAGEMITEMDDGTLQCAKPENMTNAHFILNDINGVFQRAASSGVSDDISMSRTVYDGVFGKIIASNVTGAFVEGNFAAVIGFAIFFGAALGSVLLEENRLADVATMNAHGSNQEAQGLLSAIIAFFSEINKVLLKMINWIIVITPLAVFSLIAKAVGSQDDIAGSFKNVAYLVASIVFGMAVHVLVVDVGLLWALAKINPFTYLSYIIPAQTTALACASSAATLPVTLRCVKASGFVPDNIRNFVCPLGATVNMDGSAVYFPCTCVWLAVLNGIEVNFGHFILLIILSSIGSAGTAPVPAAGLVMVITAYNTVFGGTGTPNGFEYVVATDWVLDRFQTAMNVTGDTVVAAIISARTPLDADVPTPSDAKELDSDESNEKQDVAVA